MFHNGSFAQLALLYFIEMLETPGTAVCPAPGPRWQLYPQITARAALLEGAGTPSPDVWQCVQLCKPVRLGPKKLPGAFYVKHHWCLYT